MRFWLLVSIQRPSSKVPQMGLQPTIKIENPSSYYCNSYTPPGPDHSVLTWDLALIVSSNLISACMKIIVNFFILTVVFFYVGPLALPRSLPSPQLSIEVRGEDWALRKTILGVGRRKGQNNEVASYLWSESCFLSSQTSWHSDVDHGTPTNYYHPFVIKKY